MEVTVEDWTDGMAIYGNLEISELLQNVKSIHSSLEKEFKNISVSLNHILHVDILDEFTELLKKSDKLHSDLRRLMKSISCRQNTQNICQNQFLNEQEHIPIPSENLRVNQFRHLNIQTSKKSLEHGVMTNSPLNLSVRNEVNETTNLSKNTSNFVILSERNYNCNNLRNNSNYITQNLSEPHTAQLRNTGVQFVPWNGNNSVQPKIINHNYSGIFQNSSANVNSARLKNNNNFPNYLCTNNQDLSYSGKEVRGEEKKTQRKRQPKKNKSVLSSGCVGISVEKKPRAKRQTTKGKGKTNRKDLGSDMKLATDDRIRNSIDENRLTSNATGVGTAGQGTKDFNGEQNFDPSILDENQMNEILQETNFEGHESDAVQSELNKNTDEIQLNEKSIIDSGKDEPKLITLYTANNKSEQNVIDNSENCRNNQNVDNNISPSIIYCSDDEKEVLNLQKPGLKNKFVLPITDLSEVGNNTKRRRNSTCYVPGTVPSVKDSPVSEDNNAREDDPPVSGLDDFRGQGAVCPQVVTSAGFKNAVTSNFSKDECVKNIVFEGPDEVNIPSIPNGTCCLKISSPSSPNFSNIYSQNSTMKSSLKDVTIKNPTTSDPLNDATIRNPTTSNPLNNATTSNPRAINSLNNATTSNPIPSESGNNATIRNPTTSDPLNNATTRNPTTSDYLKNATSENLSISKSIISMNIISSSSLKDNERNPTSLSKLTNTKTKGVDPSPSLKDPIVNNFTNVIRFAPNNSKGLNHFNSSSSNELKDMKNVDSSGSSSLKNNIFKNLSKDTSISNQSPNSNVPNSSWVPLLQCMPNNIPFGCGAQTTMEENGVSSMKVIRNSKQDATSKIKSTVDNKPRSNMNQSESFKASNLSDSSNIMDKEDKLLRSSEQNKCVSYSFKRKENKNIPTCSNDIVKNKNIPISNTFVKNKIKMTSKSATVSNDMNLTKNDILQKDMLNKTEINAKEGNYSGRCNNENFPMRESNKSNEQIEKKNIVENNMTNDQSLKQCSTENSVEKNHTERKKLNQGKNVEHYEPIMDTEQFLDTCNTEFVNTNTTEQNVQSAIDTIQNIRTRRVKSKGEFLQIDDFSDLYAQNIFIW